MQLTDNTQPKMEQSLSQFLEALSGIPTAEALGSVPLWPSFLILIDDLT